MHVGEMEHIEMVYIMCISHQYPGNAAFYWLVLRLTLADDALLTCKIDPPSLPALEHLVVVEVA